MRVGLVGAGRFGRRYLETLAGLPALELVAVASRNPATATLVAPHVRVLPDWRDLLALAGLDGVLVVTPPATHAAIVTQAMRRGLAVLVEKPLTVDPAEAEALLAEPATAPVIVEHTHLFAPAYRALREALGAEAIVTIDVDAGGRGPWRRDVPVLWDWGAHWVAVCLDLLGGAPDAATAVVVEQREVEGGIGQTVEVSMQFGATTAARLRLGNLRDSPCRRLVVTTAGGRTLVYDELAARPLTVSDRHGTTAPATDGPRPLAAALLAFAATAAAWRAGDRPPPPSGLAFGVEVVRTLARLDATSR